MNGVAVVMVRNSRIGTRRDIDLVILEFALMNLRLRKTSFLAESLALIYEVALW